MTVSFTQGGKTITPTREIGLACLHLRELIADCPTWKEIVANPDGTIADIDAASGASRANALAAVHIYAVYNEKNNDQGRITLPSCLIEYQVGEAIAERFGPQAFFIRTGFYVEFIFQIPDTYIGDSEDEDNAGLAYLDAVEKVEAIRQYMLNPTTESERYIIDNATLMSFSEIEENRNQGWRAFRAELLVNAESSQ